MEPLSPSSARVTIHDVARAASVSRQTVSNALKHPERVSPDTLDRVLAAIEVPTLGLERGLEAKVLQVEIATRLRVSNPQIEVIQIHCRQLCAMELAVSPKQVPLAQAPVPATNAAAHGIGSRR